MYQKYYNNKKDTPRVKNLHKYVRPEMVTISDTNEIPDDVLITVFCNSPKERGFIENVIKNELGLYVYVVDSWISQNDADSIMTAVQGVD